jgi:2-haloacid dehalogenase
MKYNLFLFDLDDTLLDFQASEKLCFKETFLHFGLADNIEEIHKTYRFENSLLWKQVEKGQIDKDFLKVERFKRTLNQHQITFSADLMASYYLEQLPKNVVLIDGAVEVCRYLKQFGQLGIITNGIEIVQRERIKNSALSSFFDFIAVSEECGFAKPDIRFFDFACKKAHSFSKETTLIIGDRIEADILGASHFGIDSCWYNPERLDNTSSANPTFTIGSLLELEALLED